MIIIVCYARYAGITSMDCLRWDEGPPSTVHIDQAKESIRGISSVFYVLV